jgi:hypothetical protein
MFLTPTKLLSALLSRSGVRVYLSTAFLSGLQFSAAYSVAAKKTGYHAGRIFTADFAGAAPGSVLCAALLVPAIGAPASFAVLSIAKLICFCRR